MLNWGGCRKVRRIREIKRGLVLQGSERLGWDAMGLESLISWFSAKHTRGTLQSSTLPVFDITFFFHFRGLDIVCFSSSKLGAAGWFDNMLRY
jgi:hypothetical protein